MLAGSTTSVLLAVMHAVPDFGAASFSYGKAPASLVRSYVENPFTDLANGDSVRPDGVLVGRRGKKRWSCLVEFKTGHEPLGQDQIERYVPVASGQGCGAILTISNEIASSAGVCPVELDRRQLRSVTLFHLSWFRILTEAVLVHEHRGVSDPDRAWILSELIEYLQHPKSGARVLRGSRRLLDGTRTADGGCRR